MLLDGVKNVAGAHALRAALAEEFADTPRTFVVGLMREKEPHEMLDALGVLDAARLVCCRPDSPRGHDPTSSPTPRTSSGSSRASIEVIDDVHDAVACAIDGPRPTARSSSPVRSTSSVRLAALTSFASFAGP